MEGSDDEVATCSGVVRGELPQLDIANKIITINEEKDSAPTCPVQQSEKVTVTHAHDANQAVVNEQGVVFDSSHSVTVCENSDMKAQLSLHF
jgi:hypothetical protein